MYHDQVFPVRSLRPNILSSRSFKYFRSVFDPTGSFSTRDPLERRGARAVHCITYPYPGEEVMFCGLVGAGMRVPFAPRVVELLRCYGLVPALLTPHGFLKWVCFIRVCKQLGIPYSLTVFRCLFIVSRHADGSVGFRNRGFELKGPGADARQARMRWFAMSLLEEKVVDDSFNYRSFYFMYRGAVPRWEASCAELECPTLNELTDEDIRCLRALCECQHSKRLEPISRGELTGLGLSDIGLEPGSWGDQGIPRAPLDVEGAEYVRGYKKGCRETQERIIEQLHQYDRQFPFASIPEIASLGASMYPEMGPLRGSWESKNLASTIIVLSDGSGSQEGVSHVADASKVSAPRSDPGPSEVDIQYLTEPSSDWSFLDILGAGGEASGGEALGSFGGAYSDPNILRFDEYGQAMAIPEWMDFYPSSSCA